MIAREKKYVSRRELLHRISCARSESDALFNVLRPDSFYERPIPERHRFIFYVGHLEAFDWNLLSERAFGLTSFDPSLDRLFAFGIDPVGGGLPSDQPSDWPSLEVAYAYAAKVRASIDERLANLTARESATNGDGVSLDVLLNVAIEHRLMHLETLAYMLHQLAFDKKVPGESSRLPAGPSLRGAPVARGMIEIPAGNATLGLARETTVFGWDNEYEAHQVPVAAFEIDEFMLTNSQFLEFIAAGGYDAPAFWSEAAWNWKTAHQIQHPVFWRKAGNEWRYRSMFGEFLLPPDWPVYVSHAEAAAYACWSGKSLPSEAEWQRAAYGTPDGAQRFYPWGDESPALRLGNFGFASWDPQSVTAFPDGRSAFGVQGMLGNGWEWTATPFGPFAGFRQFSFYPGYSADFFDGKHFVMKGGSPRTAACMLRPTFRNWFQPHYQYVYAGFRCVRR
jgi:gamma-glutamyl hercynylcysteine S-oxide synthase